MRTVFFILLLTFSVSKSYSQSSDFPKTQKTTFIYTIDKITNQQQLDKLQSEVEQIKGVSEVKTLCKWESGKGQLIFSLTEIISGTENIENIDLVVIKQLILKNDLGFVDFKIK